MSDERPEDYLFSAGPQPERVDWLGIIPADVLAAHDAEVAAQALEDAAEDVHLGDDMTQLDRHRNRNVIRNAEAEAAAWLDDRAAAIREGA